MVLEMLAEGGRDCGGGRVAGEEPDEVGDGGRRADVVQIRVRPE